MPYIPKEERPKYDTHLKKIYVALPNDLETLDGHLNYNISELVANLILGEKGGRASYHKRKCLIKTVEAAHDELKRRFLDPYEDEAIKKNGDLKIWKKEDLK